MTERYWGCMGTSYCPLVLCATSLGCPKKTGGGKVSEKKYVLYIDIKGVVSRCIKYNSDKYCILYTSIIVFINKYPDSLMFVVFEINLLHVSWQRLRHSSAPKSFSFNVEAIECMFQPSSVRISNRVKTVSFSWWEFSKIVIASKKEWA